ncbi:family 43 glycosylhydrolase [Mangrovibacterium lignilyticum]|uniref:family 43 glycosylhydrolase n=1 Tax=Mangrovibacterium lignilyticum TaxID=2668052 RepID=UPI0013D79EB5|nr:family 43 glycosylhydrolase [Mangrovibacterium lignilyticum]
MKRIFFLLLLALATRLVSAQQNEYNPLIPDNLADPTIVQFGDTFYLYATSDVGDIETDLAFSGSPVVWKSKDFVNWSFEGICFPGIDWHEHKYWAPGRVLERDGKYYLFVTVDHVTQLAVADSPEGPFSFINGPENYTGDEKPSMVIDDIDGCPFIDDDGQGYIFWRRKKAAKLSADWTKPEGETITIPTQWHGYSEGPFMIKRKGIYYYFYTMGGYADYQNGYVMSKESPLGPFVTPDNDVIISSDLDQQVWGPGHGFAFSPEGSDDWYFVYLEYGIGGTSRQVYCNQMEFNEDGTIKPIQLNRKGVGALAKLKTEQPMDLSNAVATASSVKKPMEVQARKWGDPKQLKYNLPEEPIYRHHEFNPQDAIDHSNFTRWWATPGDTEKWWQLDLGKTEKLDHLDLFFVHPSLGHAFVCEKSIDGKNWEIVKEQKEVAVRSPHKVEAIGKARFLRVKILAGQPGIWEAKLYN